ncbi:hypothetical protein RYX56_02755 [Alkalihalophilus lindianensis]|uniref:Uncharacterized protein n=1 Tax=Alkalihalophilus lindianensis TaxID=1630542 RepID=A0ABU3X5V8_9BACI|nr:hypothetical protein [Alkalihalophilus lindianensis]MDV2683287.1 hypothetical protein [Alkalihalophilus lindianensis]
MNYPVAHLEQKQLQHIRQLEQDLGVVLIAYHPEQEQGKRPEQINQHRDLDYF